MAAVNGPLIFIKKPVRLELNGLFVFRMVLPLWAPVLAFVWCGWMLLKYAAGHDISVLGLSELCMNECATLRKHFREAIVGCVYSIILPNSVMLRILVFPNSLSTSKSGSPVTK